MNVFGVGGGKGAAHQLQCVHGDDIASRADNGRRIDHALLHLDDHRLRPGAIAEALARLCSSKSMRRGAIGQEPRTAQP